VVLSINDSAVNRRAIGVNVENRQENPDATHFCFQNLGLFDFGNIVHGSISGREDRIPISRNISIWISKKEKRVEN